MFPLRKYLLCYDRERTKLNQFKLYFFFRLILGTSADSEKEEDIVEWLREVGMPADYVNRLARMFQDIKVSLFFLVKNK